MLKKIANSFDFPADITLNASKVVVIGECEVNVENYRGILEYCHDVIRIQLEDKILSIIGCNLEICTITDEDLQIKGEIKQICF